MIFFKPGAVNLVLFPISKLEEKFGYMFLTVLSFSHDDLVMVLIPIRGIGLKVIHFIGVGRCDFSRRTQYGNKILNRCAYYNARYVSRRYNWRWLLCNTRCWRR